MVAYYILLAVLLLFPIVVILRAWIVFRVMSGMLAIATMIAHLIITIVLWASHLPRLAVTYLAGSALAWAILPHTGRAADRKLRKRMRDQDIVRLERKIQRRPEHGAAHSALADAYFEAGRYQDAIAAYEQAIALDPDHSRTDRWKHQQAVELLAQQERQRTRPSANRQEPSAH